jgi:hypothetical protein
MSHEQPLNGPIPIGQPEPGIRYGGKLIRDMTDAEVAENVKRAEAEQAQVQLAMQDAVVRYGVMMAIANVLQFEHDRRTKKLRLPGDFG